MSDLLEVVDQDGDAFTVSDTLTENHQAADGERAVLLLGVNGRVAYVSAKDVDRIAAVLAPYGTAPAAVLGQLDPRRVAAASAAAALLGAGLLGSRSADGIAKLAAFLLDEEAA
ncbi:hypothetical protein GCM10010168_53480 [Actinoplanes ianthinogenes]|uniref:Uncharacterized protein n=1 Tax=Actinoplanes ianthinogenes TaxID=122358 RepID=A0ABN6C8D5_9ACTN|nr:hypothetical protein [Actinoplanes ianthinogenes]BCJ41654.1 hypothetical protein Aiant_23110 [Actinoplanes ianthinogenes]GGR28637.1 hypothetical protein GCM10010168_53480 [Actinoplanes ianthinogenes]